MKTKHFLSSAACVALSIFAASCSSEETTLASGNNELSSNGKLTSFVGTMGGEKPVTRVSLGDSDAALNFTRATMARTQRTDPALFSWEKGDCIYILQEYDYNNWIGTWNKSFNTVDNDAAPTFEFRVGGDYSKDTGYIVIYKGNDTNPEDKVTIKTEQTQSAFNNTEHFKNSGDYALGFSGWNGSENKFNFTLKHKVAYLCFLPYCTDSKTLNSKITKIKVTSSADIAGTYAIMPTDGSWRFINGTNTSTTITLNAGTDGFELTGCTAPDITKSLYMVVAPGTGSLTVDVTLSDGTVVTHTYSETELKANNVYNVLLKLFSDPLNFDNIYLGSSYYSWNAANNYWNGCEWNSDNAKQPTANGNTAEGFNQQENAPVRLKDCTELFKSLPSANAMTWYASKGDAHWDANTEWTLFGKTHKGGVWLKKLEVIAQELGKTKEQLQNESSTDSWDATTNSWRTSVQQGKPADITNYFFLPAAGYYLNGACKDPDTTGAYWSTSATTSWSYSYPIALVFDSSKIKAQSMYNYFGLIANKYVFK